MGLRPGAQTPPHASPGHFSELLSWFFISGRLSPLPPLSLWAETGLWLPRCATNLAGPGLFGANSGRCRGQWRRQPWESAPPPPCHSCSGQRRFSFLRTLPRCHPPALDPGRQCCCRIAGPGDDEPTEGTRIRGASGAPLPFLAPVPGRKGFSVPVPSVRFLAKASSGLARQDSRIWCFPGPLGPLTTLTRGACFRRLQRLCRPSVGPAEVGEGVFRLTSRVNRTASCSWAPPSALHPSRPLGRSRSLSPARAPPGCLSLSGSTEKSTLPPWAPLPPPPPWAPLPHFR